MSPGSVESRVDVGDMTVLTISSAVVYVGLWKKYTGGKNAWRTVVGQSLPPPGIATS